MVNHLIVNMEKSMHELYKNYKINLTFSNFSCNFVRSINELNFENTRGIPDNAKLCYTIFASLVYQESINQIISNKGIESFLDKYNNSNIYYQNQIKPDGRIFTYFNKYLCEDIFQYLYKYNYNFYESIDKLSMITNINYRNIFYISKNKFHSRTDQNDYDSSNQIKYDLLVPKYLNVNYKYINIVDKTDILSVDNFITGSFLRYKAGNSLFSIPAMFFNGFLRVGVIEPESLMMNNHLLKMYPFSSVILILDINSAIEINKYLQNSCKYNPSEFIVTTFLGLDPSQFDWREFANRSVVIVPSLDKITIQIIKILSTYIRQGGATRLSYYQGFLLHAKPWVDISRDSNSTYLVNEPEEGLIDSLIYIGDIERPVKLIENIISESVDLKTFTEWCFAHNLLEDKNIIHTKEENLNNLTIDPEMVPPSAKDFESISLGHLIRPQNLTLIEGDKDAGKSRFAFSLCQSIISGNAIINTFINNIKPSNVCYVDIETPFDVLQERCQEYKIDNHLYLISELDSDVVNKYKFCNEISLNNKDFRDGLLNFILQKECRYLFLDHAIGLIGANINNDFKTNTIKDWILDLFKRGIGVVLLHHLNIKGKNNVYNSRESGSQIFKRTAGTVIHLESKLNIIAQRLGTAKVQEYAKGDNLTFGIYFHTSKYAPILKGKTIWCYQENNSQINTICMTNNHRDEINNNFENYIDKFKKDDDKYNNSVKKIDLEDSRKFYEEKYGCELNNDEILVIKNLEERSSLQTKDVEKIINKCNTSAYKLMNNLIDKGIIERNGENRNTTYTLKPYL